jgi:hypothetical protein
LSRDHQILWRSTLFGVPISVQKQVLPTDGIMFDSLLGQGEALDAYSKGMQEQQVEAKRLENRRAAAEAERLTLAMSIVKDGDTARARIF